MSWFDLAHNLVYNNFIYRFHYGIMEPYSIRKITEFILIYIMVPLKMKKYQNNLKHV